MLPFSMQANPHRARAGLRGRVGALALGVLLASSALAQEPSDEGRPRGILLIAVDGLRADHLGSFGYDRDTTTHLDALAAEGTTFTQAFTSSPLPVPSYVALFSGCEPLLARRVLPDVEATDEQRWNIPDELPRLAVEFLAAGYNTTAFVDDQALQSAFGFSAGFQDYLLTADNERGAEKQTTRVLQWIRGRKRDKRWFAVMHLNDLERCWFVPNLETETYYQPRVGAGFIPAVSSANDAFFAIPHDRWRGSRTLGQYEAIYDGHLRRVDQALGRLFTGLRASKLLDETIVCVVGTYGVQFGEAGLYLRAGRYSMADLHVPWILRVPRRWNAEVETTGNRIEALASLLDVGPTLVDLAGLPSPIGMQGISQAKYVFPPGEGEPPEGTTRTEAYASCGLQEGVTVIDWSRYCLEFLVPDRTLSSLMRRSWFGEDRLGEVQSTVRFYDRSVDPHPPLGIAIPSPPPPEFDEMRTRATRWLENVTLARQVLQENLLFHERVDEATVERLKAEGWLGRKVGTGE